ncbi:putative spermidine/putrescine transport system ATP-binding protein [Trinickia symbiotica]|uniref:Spermidine/putrescine import ATP-binding protein PotA n=1 Tax=Trinickia symbiotica TaxID=863227 RepID=A0A2N7X5I2_9BURK|nr:ABC transporter ATP-binding protein [Trinickia symbiotica]PMS36831.1 spermidine/putrescine ABC transporter ATP-binding protein [Trinickia symbiotica]PPK46286.1 putative spermidine/putrescine transport system ATP-binding protein [Trinickia symbiotica]
MNMLNVFHQRERGNAERVDADHVVFSQVEKSYDGSTHVVKSLSLSVRRGEFLTLLGPSGSGKTTTLMMLAGFEAPTAGTISIGGVDLTTTPPHKRGIGMVFQNYALFPHMSIADNVAFPLVARKMSKSEIGERVTRALQMVKMQNYASRRPAQLSGGQQQRIALARALVFEPTLVLMDEPLGALDKQLREHMQTEIKHLHKMLGVTVVYVTHDQDEALAMSDRVAIFNNGAIEQIGPPTEIYESPNTEFVSRFVGDNNLLEGVVDECYASDSGNYRAKITHGACRFEALASKPLVAGTRVTLVLRPERVSLAGQDGALENQVSSQIVESTYFGDHVRLTCRIPGGNEITVKLANTSSLGSLQAGQTLPIGWRSADSRALLAVGA